LDFNDFKAQPESQNIASAISFIGFKCNYEYDTDSNLLRFQVKSFFDPRKSWIKKHDSLTLDHEQIYFNIAELITRQLCREFLSVVVDFMVDKKVEFLINKYKVKLKEYHDQYDKETLFGIDLVEQRKWKERINLELNAYL
jgi:hypothetical protein